MKTLLVNTGPVPNGYDPILERTISVHTVPFRLSTSVHTGPVCYGSVLNRSKKSSCFYQLSMRRIHVVAFKMAPKKLNCAASTKRNWSRCLHGDGSVWDRNGSKTGSAFMEVQFSDLIGNGLTVRLEVPCEQKTYPSRILDRNHLEPAPCEHSLELPSNMKLGRGLMRLYHSFTTRIIAHQFTSFT